MARLNWHTKARTFETGLDRGVLYPKNALAVAWNGLTGIDEDGADEATTYYLDGQPYLHVPKPKEFTAKLKAYTYPDEFASALGVTEATDGMYLDSQQGDTFDLCYRTLIGDGNAGEQVGYKIHLIYNAIVTPDSISYQSIGSSIDPFEFSWAIKAVPVTLTGFRPTAHVMIDTRHLDSQSIDVIENLIYGTDSTVASLPRPDVILNALSFGDTIVITDNGDGTWTAEGSYQNIYSVGDGEFQIDNVDATHNLSAGTYTFGTGSSVSVIIIDGGTSDYISTLTYDGGTPSSNNVNVLDGGSLSDGYVAPSPVLTGISSFITEPL